MARLDLLLPKVPAIDTVIDTKISRYVKPRDWPEDFHRENGMYMHSCAHCESGFIGHKGRWICRLCGKEEMDSVQELLDTIEELIK